MHEEVARVIQEIPSLLPDPLCNERRVAIREIVDIHYSRHLKRFFVLASFRHSLLDAHTAWIDQALFDRPLLHYKCNNKTVLNALKKKKHLASTVIVDEVINPPKLFGQIIPLPPGMSGWSSDRALAPLHTNSPMCLCLTTVHNADNADHIIQKILLASHNRLNFDDFFDRAQFKRIAKIIHPDKCSHPQATIAFQQLMNAISH